MCTALWMTLSAIFDYAFRPIPLVPYVVWKLRQKSCTHPGGSHMGQTNLVSDPPEMPAVPHEKLPNRLDLLTQN